MTIIFSELDGTINVPTTAVETDLDAGAVGLPSLNKRLLILANATSAGTATEGDALPISDLADAIEKWGIGSNVAVMVEAALRISKRIPLFGMSYPESAGVVATGIVTLATPAAGNGALSITVAGRTFKVGVQTLDSETVVAAAMVLKINAHPNLPVTAANVAGVLTMTSRLKGTQANTIRYRSKITSGIGMTSADTGAVFVGGTLAGDPTAVLAAIEAQRFHIIALDTDDAAAAAVLETHLEAQSDALTQRWGFGIQGAVGNLPAAVAAALTFDSFRMQLIWHQGSDQPIFELAAAYGAERARITRRNQTLDDHKLAGITAQFDESLWPNHSDEDGAIVGGVVPIRPLRSGEIEIVRNVLTKPQSVTPAFQDAEPMEISDFIDEDLISFAKARFSDSALKVLSPAATPGVVTPARFKLLLHERMRHWDTVLDYTQGAEADIQAGATRVEPNTSDNSRLDSAYPFRPVFGAHVLAIKKTFTAPPIAA